MHDPSLGGGIQHVSDCITAYLKRPDRDDGKLIEYALRLDNGAVSKRLGYVAEKNENGGTLPEMCSRHLTAGIAKLDLALACETLVSKWRLLIPRNWAKGAAA